MTEDDEISAGMAVRLTAEAHRRLDSSPRRGRSRSVVGQVKAMPDVRGRATVAWSVGNRIIEESMHLRWLERAG